MDDVSGLSQLGSNETQYLFEHPSAKTLERFPNQYRGRDYVIRLEFPEFSSLCPRTGQPDFANFTIEYVADEFCVESKSLKLYFFNWRNEGSFMETITNTVLEHIVEAISPRWCKVVGNFNPRGGLRIIVTAEHHKENR